MKSKINFKILLAFAAIYVIWGTTYLAVKIGLETIPPFLMASMRYIISGILLLTFCAMKGESLFTKNVVRNMLLGAFILTFGQAVLFWCEKYISSGLTSVFGSTLPIWYIFADKRNWRSYFSSKMTLLSIALGLIGIIILFVHPSEAVTGEHNTFMAVVASVAAIVSCYCWAAGSLYYNYQKKEGSIYLNVGWQLIGGMFSCGLVSLIGGELKHFSFVAVSWSGWGAVVFLAIFGSIIAFISLYWLLARRPAPIVGTYAYINPVIAVLLGYFIAKETISITQMTGMIIILIAAYLANSVKFMTAE